MMALQILEPTAGAQIGSGIGQGLARGLNQAIEDKYKAMERNRFAQQLEEGGYDKNTARILSQIRQDSPKEFVRLVQGMRGDQNPQPQMDQSGVEQLGMPEQPQSPMNFAQRIGARNQLDAQRSNPVEVHEQKKAIDARDKYVSNLKEGYKAKKDQGALARQIKSLIEKHPDAWPNLLTRYAPAKYHARNPILQKINADMNKLVDLAAAASVKGQGGKATATLLNLKKEEKPAINMPRETVLALLNDLINEEDQSREKIDKYRSIVKSNNGKTPLDIQDLVEYADGKSDMTMKSENAAPKLQEDEKGDIYENGIFLGNKNDPEFIKKLKEMMAQ